MGRRPDQVVLEFFERGPKIADSSNRYQQTCRSCGEVFPKGRSDNLKSHLKKCSRLSQKDRARLMRGSQEQLRKHGLEDDNTHSRLASQERDLPRTNSPSLAWSESTSSPKPEADKPSRMGSISSPSALSISQLLSPTPQSQERTILRPATSSAWGEPTALHSSPVISPAPHAHAPDFVIDLNRRPPILPSITSFPSPELTPNGNSYAAQRMIHDGALPPPGLTLEPLMSPGPPLPPMLSRSTSSSSMSDHYFRQPFTSRPSQEPMQGNYSPPSLEAATISTVDSGHGNHRWVTHNTDRSGYNNGVIYVPLVESRLPRGQKRNIRSKFDDGRRKEVQGVRALGACIRCKMLKKPCSGGDPCKTCNNIGNARVWAFPCTRDRMQDLLQINSDCFYTSAVDTLMSMLQDMEPSRQVLTALHEGNDEISLVLEAMRVTKVSEPFQRELQAFSAGRDAEIIVINPKSERIGAELLRYSQRKFPEFVSAERSPYASRTLEMAQKMKERSQDMLIEKILNLWAMIPILTDNEMRWSTYVSEHLASPKSEINETSSRIITAQLKAEAEKRAASLTKQILSDLERRLFQRAQGGWFETVLVAMLLTMCVEKQMWLLQRWERGVYRPLEKWPSEKSLEQCQARTEEFVSLLGMLLKLGGLSSKIKKDQAGNIFSDDKYAKSYFESLSLTETILEERQQSVFDPHDPLSYELKMCSKLLLLSI